jgi:hypothetical protein
VFCKWEENIYMHGERIKIFICNLDLRKSFEFLFHHAVCFSYNSFKEQLLYRPENKLIYIRNRFVLFFPVTCVLVPTYRS